MRDWLNQFKRISKGTKRAEEDLMDTFDKGRRIAGSGSVPISRSWAAPIVASQIFGSTRNKTAGGDGLSRLFLVEHKRTHQMSQDITRTMLRIIEQGAARGERTPLLAISFKNAEIVRMEHRLKQYMEWGVIRFDHFQNLANAGTLYNSRQYYVTGESFGWTRLRVRDAIARGLGANQVPSVLVHFVPKNSTREPELDVAEGLAETWIIVPLVEVQAMERAV